MKRAFLLYIAVTMGCGLLAVVLLWPVKTPWVDQSHKALLPAEVDAKLSTFRDFPVFWWNFVVFENAASDESLHAVRAACRALNEKARDWVKSVPCATDLDDSKTVLLAWIRDLPLRREAPPADELRVRMDATLAKASMPLPASLMPLLREDPFDSIEDLRKLSTEKAKLSFEQQDGLFIDRRSGRVLAPIQLNYSPTLTENTLAVSRLLDSLPADFGLQNARLFGAHAATLENELRVRNDVEAISIAGTLLLGLLCVGLVYARRGRLLLYFPPLFASTALAMALTVRVFGNIHGIALAFGPGIIGLAMDYGIHAAFAPKDKRGTWLANSLGLLTTMTVIVVGLLSRLPVLRQLMFFSGTGLLIGFVAFFALQRGFPSLFEARPFSARLPKWSWLSRVSTGLTFVALLGLVTFRPALDMNTLNYQSSDTAQLNRWMFVDGQLKTPFLQVFGGSSPLDAAARQEEWSRKNKIRLESIADYVPSVEAQSRNFQSWQRLLCGSKNGLAKVQIDFFAPFLAVVPCEGKRTQAFDSPEAAPLYLSDLRSGSHWVSLWFPENEGDVAKLKAAFPDVAAPTEIASLFPRILANELGWMGPTTFVLAFLILCIYYRRLRPAVFAVLPFFTGLGAYFLVSFFIPMQISFITLIGFIMIFGFSLDYGIFAADSSLVHEKQDDAVRSALSLTTLTTLAGFLPLLFGQHPSMRHLGQALVLGSIGTYLGAVYAIPWLSTLSARAPRSQP